MSVPRSVLVTIIAHARSGALEHAWRLFRAAGLESVDDDPAVLSLRGRLLKDQALGADAPAAREFYRQAGDAYGRAGAISGATYPLINAATLALLAGDGDQAQRRARSVLALLEAGESEPDTPYYRAATRAEALVLLGQTASAAEALSAAMALAPRAWEDHASTLQQFARILAARGEAAGWLDALRPPRSLQFGGHMTLDPDDLAAVPAVTGYLAAERVGFGFGALAAGADIVIAEALLAREAELHLILPAPPATFRARSVEAMGSSWGARFDAVLPRAETVRWVGHPDDPVQSPGVRLAAEMAMGAAIQHARALASEAVQLLIVDPFGSDRGESGGTAWMAGAWQATGLRQRCLPAPRSGRPVSLSGAAPVALAAMLLVELDGASGSLTEAGRLAAVALPRLAAAIADGPAPVTSPSWRGLSAQLLYPGPVEAAAAALGIVAALAGVATVRIGGAYGLLPRDASGQPLALGRDAEAPAAILRSAPPGVIHVTEAFALALLSADGAGVRVEYVGDLPDSDVEQPVRLYSLRPGPAPAA